MPFRQIPAGQFNLETMQRMQEAFDKACLQLHLSADDPRRSQLANEIIKLAVAGETDLVGKAVSTLKK